MKQGKKISKGYIIPNIATLGAPLIMIWLMGIAFTSLHIRVNELAIFFIGLIITSVSIYLVYKHVKLPFIAAVYDFGDYLEYKQGEKTNKIYISQIKDIQITIGWKSSNFASLKYINDRNIEEEISFYFKNDWYQTLWGNVSVLHRLEEIMKTVQQKQ